MEVKRGKRAGAPTGAGSSHAGRHDAGSDRPKRENDAVEETELDSRTALILNGNLSDRASDCPMDGRSSRGSGADHPKTICEPGSLRQILEVPVRSYGGAQVFSAGVGPRPS
jgi:hypothetical protein